MSVCVAGKIPTRLNKCVHCIGFPCPWTSTSRARDINKVFVLRKRRTAVRTGLDIQRQNNREIFYRDRNCSAMFTIYNWDRGSPITLSGDIPVTEPISDSLSSLSLELK